MKYDDILNAFSNVVAGHENERQTLAWTKIHECGLPDGDIEVGDFTSVQGCPDVKDFLTEAWELDPLDPLLELSRFISKGPDAPPVPIRVVLCDMDYVDFLLPEVMFGMVHPDAPDDIQWLSVWVKNGHELGNGTLYGYERRGMHLYTLSEESGAELSAFIKHTVTLEQI